jgi:hypothetical protein
MSDSIEPLDDSEREALSSLGDGPETTTQYAVVYYRRGGPAATGPLPWHAAEKQAADRRGIPVRRTMTITYGPWEPVE